MSRLFACLSTLLVSAMVLAACPASSPAPQAAPTATQQAPAAQATEAPAAQQGTATQLTLAKNDEYGEYLADGAGRALYLFAADEGAQGSTCNDQCAKVWPPLTVAQAKDVTAGDGVDKSLIGTVQRQDGTQQVTYHGHPVYYYTIDEGQNRTPRRGGRFVWRRMVFGDLRRGRVGKSRIRTAEERHGNAGRGPDHTGGRCQAGRREE